MSNSIITKKALANSLKELMKTTPLNKISVQNIVENCGLNRQTFYYHFMDIFDLVEWIYKTEAVVIQWMNDDMKEDPKLIIERLSELIEGNFVKALQKYEHKSQ